MPENLVDFNGLEFLFNPPEDEPFKTGKDARKPPGKRIRVAELIHDNDKLVQQLQEKDQHLVDLKRTASEVTEIYQREKQQRIELESRIASDNTQCANLEQQLEMQRLNCEQLRDELVNQRLPVEFKDLVRSFMHRLASDAQPSGPTRGERHLILQLKDYCNSENITLPTLKSSPSKKRSKQQLQQDVSSKRPEMRSTAVQTDKLITRDQGIQHKNTTTTRGTTTSSLIQMHDVGTSCGPEPKTAEEILAEILSWNTTPLSPIGDPPMVATTASIGTCTDVCNIQREIDFLPDHLLPAQMKCSESRPPSRNSYSNVKDELPVPAEAVGGDSHHMARDLLGFWPHNQSILAKLPPPLFEQVWQIMGKLVHVALQGDNTNPINQADFHNWLDTISESSLNQAHSVPPFSGSRSNNSSGEHHSLPQPSQLDQRNNLLADAEECMASSKETASQDVGLDPIVEPPPKIGLELTPIRLPSLPKIKPKKCTQRFKPYSRKVPKPRPMENAVQFLSHLNDFSKPNCDNFDVHLNAEELLLLGLTTESHHQPSDVVVDCEKLASKGNQSTDSTAINLSLSTEAEEMTAIDYKSKTSQEQPAADLDCGEAAPLCPVAGSDFKSNDNPEPPAADLDCGQVAPQCQVAEQLSKSGYSSEDNLEPPAAGLDCGQVAPKCQVAEELSKSGYSAEDNQKPPAADLDCGQVAPQCQVAEELSKSGYSSDDNQEPQNAAKDCGKVTPQSPVAEYWSDSSDLAADDDQVASDNSASLSSQNTDIQQLPEISTSSVNFKDSTDSKRHLLVSLFGDDADSDDEEAPVLNFKPCQPQQTEATTEEAGTDSDEDSRDSCNLFIDDSYQQHNTFENLTVPSDAEEPPALFPVADKRRRTESASGIDDDNLQSNSSEDLSVTSDDEPPALFPVAGKRRRTESGSVINDDNLQSNSSEDLTSTDEQPALFPVAGKRQKKSESRRAPVVVKRMTRLQAKKQLLQGDDKPISSEVSELLPSSIYDCSPMSPKPCSQDEETAPIIIPLEPPVVQFGAKEPKALLNYIINSVKQRGKRKVNVISRQVEQLELQIVDSLKKSMPLNLTPAQLVYADANVNVVVSALIAAHEKLQDSNVLENLLTVIKPCKIQRYSFIERLMNTLEQLLFRQHERPAEQLALNYVKLYLELMTLQASLAEPLGSYVYPARLLLAKILYHYNRDMTLLVLTVLQRYPSVLPHREERGYDHSDPLITVIKYRLMNHKYEVNSPDGPDRTLISKLRFEYHFQPYEPNRQQVIENLVEKLKAGRVQQLCFAFALFCKGSPSVMVIRDVLAAQLLPLANNYCDLCIQGEMYDERMECLLSSISVIAKQLPLDSKLDITVYIALFQRVLVAAPRSDVQQAAVQAILRTQRYGYPFAINALQSYRPNYQLSSMTRAMLRSFAERRRNYQKPD